MKSQSIIIPCKPLAEGKSRLAAVLTATDRQKLCTELLLGTLRIAGEIVGFDNVVVVTNDPAVSSMAHGHSAYAVMDDNRGFNHALSQARDALAGRYAQLLILPIDLPYATANLIDAVFVEDADVVIAPDGRAIGTNVLCLGHEAQRGFCFSFGKESFAAHCRQAVANKWRLRVVHDWALSTDIDEVADYLAWRGALPTSRHMSEHSIREGPK